MPGHSGIFFMEQREEYEDRIKNETLTNDFSRADVPDGTDIRG
jgi:hypothetical protein